MHVLSMERRVAVVEHLTDGAGVRAASRLTGVHKTTILSLILKLGAGCEWLHNRLVRGLSINRIECDEMHTFIHTREHNLRGDEPGEWGTSWLWLAVASTAKLIISYRVAPTREESDAELLIRDLRSRLATCATINTDGLQSYEGPIKRWFGGPGGGVEYAQVVKNFQGKRGRKDYDRYAPPTQPVVTKRPVFGTPNLDEERRADLDNAGRFDAWDIGPGAFHVGRGAFLVGQGAFLVGQGAFLVGQGASSLPIAVKSASARRSDAPESGRERGRDAEAGARAGAGGSRSQRGSTASHVGQVR